MTATPFIQGGDGGRYSGIVTNPGDARQSQSRTLYVGGNNDGDNGCVWLQIGTDCVDLGLVDPNPNEDDDISCVYMSLDDAQGLVIELLSRIRKIREEAGAT